MSIAQREIRFRFWSNVTKKMYEDLNIIGVHYKFNNNPPIYTGDLIPDEYVGERVHSYSDGHVMQYTGLKDKNGTEIYEGDIVRGVHRIHEIEMVQEVTFLNDCFMFGNWNAHEYFNKHQGPEVIGNIRENPELLENHHD